MYELGNVRNVRRHPWCGGPARYAGRQDIIVRLHTPTFSHINTKNTLRRASPTYTVPSQHRVSTVPPDNGDALGTYAIPLRCSQGSSAASFCDEVCHVQATSLSPPHYLESAPTLGLEQGHYARMRPSSPFPPTETTDRPAPPSLVAASIRLNHKSQNMYLCNLAAQHGSVN